MIKKKKASRQSNMNTSIKQKQDDSPNRKKFALILFGIGPIVLVGWFLFVQGFFDPL